MGRTSRSIDACEGCGQVHTVVIRVAVVEGSIEGGVRSNSVRDDNAIQSVRSCNQGRGDCSVLRNEVVHRDLVSRRVGYATGLPRRGICVKYMQEGQINEWLEIMVL
jgi:hypothetical protein